MNAKNEIIRRLDAVLEPLAFRKKKMIWNRASDSFVDVVDVQTSKAGDMMTVNAGVIHRDIYAKCWQDVLPEFVEESSCIIRARVGRLVGDKDLWWKVAADGVADDLADKVSTYVIPFLDQMHSIDAMEQFLADEQVVKQKYPLPIIYLAILKCEQGDNNAACALLNGLKEQSAEAWQVKISHVARILPCSYVYDIVGN